MSPPDHTFLFHTAFCCSTLLARCLGEPGKTTALLEPMALVDAANQMRESDLTTDTLSLIVRLLTKTPTGDPAILIKPSNLASILAQALLELPGSTRALLLTSSLREFMVSCSKKPDETRRKMPWLLRTLSQGTPAKSELMRVKVDHLDYLQCCALIWHVQQVNWDQHAHPGLRWIRMSVLLEHTHAVVRASATHLGLPAPSAAHLNQVLGRHAKDPCTHYSQNRKQQETALIEQIEGAKLDRTMDWYLSTMGGANSESLISQIEPLSI